MPLCYRPPRNEAAIWLKPHQWDFSSMITLGIWHLWKRRRRKRISSTSQLASRMMMTKQLTNSMSDWRVVCLALAINRTRREKSRKKTDVSFHHLWLSSIVSRSNYRSRNLSVKSKHSWAKAKDQPPSMSHRSWHQPGGVFLQEVVKKSQHMIRASTTGTERIITTL